MKALLDSLFLEITLRPDLGRLVSAFLISGGMIVGTLLCARALRHRSAAARSMLWRVCIAGLLVLALWQLSPKMPVSVQLEVIGPAEPVTVSAPAAVIPPQPPQPPPAAWERALSLIGRHGHDVWLFGAVFIFSLQFVRQTHGLRRLRKSALDVSAEVEQVAAEVAKSLDLAANSFSCHRVAGLGSPLLTGVLKPRVWLPAEAEAWPAERLRAVFQHELAHLKRKDLPWQVLAMLAGCLWWWQPLVRLASRALRAEAEEAADDIAILRNGTAADYARTLVEIAAGWEPGRVPPAPGLAMYGSRENLRKRVHSLLRENRWRGRVGWTALLVISVVGVALLVLASTRLDFSPPKPTYTSLAKLVAGGQVANHPTAVSWHEQLDDFYGTIVETLESAEMKKRALARAHALHPDFKGSGASIRVAQTKGSAIFTIFASGEEPASTRIFLDALLDEFIAFRQQIRSQGGFERALSLFTEAAAKRGKALQESAAKLEAFRKTHDTHMFASTRDGLAEKLLRLKAREAETEARLSDVAVVQSNPETALRNLERGFKADGTGRLEAGRGLTQAEQSYLNSLADAFALQQELDFMKSSETAGEPALRTNLEQRVTKAKHLAASWGHAIQQQTAEEKVLLEVQLQRIRGEIEATRKDAMKAAAELAEHERLDEEFRAAKVAHDQMHRREQDLQTAQLIQTDYVAIMERASNAYMDVQTSGIPVWRLWAKRPDKASGN